ncbi:MAG: isoprenylcysteine carboxylmethyltransferase family protein [Vulcanimicrobiaceae bacterium]
MTGAVALLGLLTLQRTSELVIATRNTRALVRRGAFEVGASHYPVMVALHASWLATLWIFGSRQPLAWGFVAAFAVLQCGRAWVLATLRDRWTTRIIVLPDAAPIVSGPFRFVRHPNYLIVAFEIPCVSLALGLLWHAWLFGLLDLAMLAWRIRSEDRAYAASARGVA